MTTKSSTVKGHEDRIEAHAEAAEANGASNKKRRRMSDLSADELRARLEKTQQERLQQEAILGARIVVAENPDLKQTFEKLESAMNRMARLDRMVDSEGLSDKQQSRLNDRLEGYRKKVVELQQKIVEAEALADPKNRAELLKTQRAAVQKQLTAAKKAFSTAAKAAKVDADLLKVLVS